MSDAFSMVGPLCQAAILTFQPFSLLTKITLASVVSVSLIKAIASVVKTIYTLSSFPIHSSYPKAALTLAHKYNLPLSQLKIITSQKLIAFVSSNPLLHSTIFLSKGVFTQLTPKQQEAVFLHELSHWQKRDPIWQLALRILSDSFFFLPTVKDWANYWHQQAEHTADAFAVKHLNSVRPLQNALKTWLIQPTSEETPNWATHFAKQHAYQQLADRAQVVATNQAVVRSVQQKIWLTARLAFSLLVLLTLMAINSSHISQVSATVVIPQSSQCTQIWPAASFSQEIMSYQ